MPISLCVYLLIFVYRHHHPIVIPGRSQVMHQGVHVLHGGDRLSASESLRSWGHRETTETWTKHGRNMETWHGKNMKDAKEHKMLFSCVILWLLCTLKISKDSSALTPIWRMNHQSDPEPCHIFIEMLWHVVTCCDISHEHFSDDLLARCYHPGTEKLCFKDYASRTMLKRWRFKLQSSACHMWCICDA